MVILHFHLFQSIVLRVGCRYFCALSLHLMLTSSTLQSLNHDPSTRVTKKWYSFVACDKRVTKLNFDTVMSTPLKVSRQRIESIIKLTKIFHACVVYTILPFVTYRVVIRFSYVTLLCQPCRWVAIGSQHSFDISVAIRAARNLLAANWVGVCATAFVRSDHTGVPFELSSWNFQHLSRIDWATKWRWKWFFCKFFFAYTVTITDHFGPNYVIKLLGINHLFVFRVVKRHNETGDIVVKLMEGHPCSLLNMIHAVCECIRWNLLCKQKQMAAEMSVSIWRMSHIVHDNLKLGA